MNMLAKLGPYPVPAHAETIDGEFKLAATSLGRLMSLVLTGRCTICGHLLEPSGPHAAIFQTNDGEPFHRAKLKWI